MFAMCPISPQEIDVSTYKAIKKNTPTNNRGRIYEPEDHRNVIRIRS